MLHNLQHGCFVLVWKEDNKTGASCLQSRIEISEVQPGLKLCCFDHLSFITT
jgi:hypothetical protein